MERTYFDPPGELPGATAGTGDDFAAQRGIARPPAPAAVPRRLIVTPPRRAGYRLGDAHPAAQQPPPQPTRPPAHGYTLFFPNEATRAAVRAAPSWPNALARRIARFLNLVRRS